MATLVLDKVWLNLMATGESVAAKSWDRSGPVGVEGEVRTYGGGRRRAVTQAGLRVTKGFTLRRVTAQAKTRLESWLGLDVMYRDYRGDRIVGVIFDLDPREYQDPQWYDIAITLNGVTWAEATPA